MSHPIGWWKGIEAREELKLKCMKVSKAIRELDDAVEAIKRRRFHG